MQISNHEDPLSGQHRGNGVVEYVEEVEAPEWQAVIGPELHMYECMPQRYVTCLTTNKCKSFWTRWARGQSCLYVYALLVG